MGMRVRAVAAAGLLVVALAACGGDPDVVNASSTMPLPLPNSAFVAALRQVPDSPATRAHLVFSRPAATTRANAEQQDPLRGVFTESVPLGYEPLMRSGPALPSAVGIDPMGAGYAVTAGRGRQGATLLDGLDVSGLPAKVPSLGGKAVSGGPGTTYRMRPDGADSSDDGLASALPGVGYALNVVRVGNRTMRSGPSTASLGNVSGSGEGLLADGGVRQVAACLGDVLSAEVTNQVPTPAPGHTATVPPSLSPAAAPTPAGGVQVVGVGIRRDLKLRPQQVMCVAFGSQLEAIAGAKAIRATLATGVIARLLYTWHEQLPGAGVKVRGSVVELTADPLVPKTGAPIMELPISMRAGDLPGIR